jgi:hypothetical protein
MSSSVYIVYDKVTEEEAEARAEEAVVCKDNVLAVCVFM